MYSGTNRVSGIVAVYSRSADIAIYRGTRENNFNLSVILHIPSISIELVQCTSEPSYE